MVEIDQISSVLDWKTFFVLSEESASFILNEIEIEQPPPNFRQVQEIFGIFQIQSRWNWLLYSTKITRILSPADAWTIASSVLIWKTDSFFGFRHRKKTSIFFILHESKMKEKTEMVCHERWEISSERKKRLRSVLLRIFSSPNHRFFFVFFKRVHEPRNCRERSLLRTWSSFLCATSERIFIQQMLNDGCSASRRSGKRFRWWQRKKNIPDRSRWPWRCVN